MMSRLTKIFGNWNELKALRKLRQTKLSSNLDQIGKGIALDRHGLLAVLKNLAKALWGKRIWRSSGGLGINIFWRKRLLSQQSALIRNE